MSEALGFAIVLFDPRYKPAINTLLIRNYRSGRNWDREELIRFWDDMSLVPRIYYGVTMSKALGFAVVLF